MKIFNDITQTVGNTPLVKINKLTVGIQSGTQVLVKIESFNPLSSVKDRIGVAMIEDAEIKGRIKPGDTLIEPTSGNTGVALAFTAAAKGYKLILTMPDTMSVERRQLLAILGAQLVLTPGVEGMKGAVAKAESLSKEIKGSIVMGQFDNPANPEIHRKTTAEEIWKDTDGKVDIFVSGIGTGGTITGVGETLKKKNKNIKIIAVEPDDSPLLSAGQAGSHKIQGIGANFIPSVLDKSVIDEIIRVKEVDAGETARNLAKQEGILAGISSGAALWGAIEIAKRPENKGKTIVVILPDTGERYLSTWLFKDVVG
ncbi:MAG: cysteine synthase A [bacterium]